MKTAIAIDRNDVESIISERFGRAPYFCLVDPSGSYEIMENPATKEQHGAGTATVNLLARHDVKKVICGKVGPNAEYALQSANITFEQQHGTCRDYINGQTTTDEYTQKNQTKMDAAQTLVGKVLFPLNEKAGMESSICEHFGHAPFFGVYDTSTKELHIEPNTLDHSANISPIDQLQQTFDFDCLFCKHIGQRALMILDQKGIKTCTGDHQTIAEVFEQPESVSTHVQDCGH